MTEHSTSPEVKKKPDIHKAAGVIIKDRHLLVARSRGKNVFVAPGGKLEANETPVEAVVRELGEEFLISFTDAQRTQLGHLGTFFAQAAGHTDIALLQMDVFIVPEFTGEITPSAEVDEIAWVNSTSGEKIPLGSIFEHDVIPILKEQDLID